MWDTINTFSWGKGDLIVEDSQDEQSNVTSPQSTGATVRRIEKLSSNNNSNNKSVDPDEIRKDVDKMTVNSKTENETESGNVECIDTLLPTCSHELNLLDAAKGFANYSNYTVFTNKICCC